MTFVNEVVPEEDIQKYDLDNLINTVKGFYLKEDTMKMPQRRLEG